MATSRWAWTRWGGLAVLLLLGLFAVVAAHIGRLGQDALAESDRAMASGDATTAITRARDAAMAMAPGSSTPGEAYARLVKIAEAGESRGDFEHAEEAWRAVRSAIRSTRSEAREAALMDESGVALVRLSGRVCEGNQSHPPAVCAAATQVALSLDDLPPVASFSWLGLGAVAFFAGAVGALRIPGPRARLVGAVVAVAGVATATLAVVIR